MPRSKVETYVLKKEQGKEETKWTLQFSNNTKQLAFFVNPRLMNDQEEVLPAFWSSNFFSLAPGESLTTTVSGSTEQLKSKTQQLLVKGWNVEERWIQLDK